MGQERIYPRPTHDRQFGAWSGVVGCDHRFGAWLGVVGCDRQFGARRILLGAVRRYGHDDLAELRAALKSREGFSSLRDVEYRIDRWQQATIAQLVRDRCELGVVAHGGTEDGPLVPEQFARVGDDRLT